MRIIPGLLSDQKLMPEIHKSSFYPANQGAIPSATAVKKEIDNEPTN
jgi:hypothetical protein